MVISENDKWVIFEVAEVDGNPMLFVSPETLKLENGFLGNIIWFVFTPGWELDAIQFPADTGFDGRPQPDPDRPGCWSTAASNTTPGEFKYSVLVQDGSGHSTERFDPVVENEPPPSPLDVRPVTALAAVS
jgi:hypothetical protein